MLPIYVLIVSGVYRRKYEEHSDNRIHWFHRNPDSGDSQSNDDLNIVALAAGKNIKLLEKQAREFRPEIIGIWSEEDAAVLKQNLCDTDIKVVSGMDGLIEIAELQSSDILVTGIVGMIGIRPTIAAINAGKDIALANKETLVTAGHIIMPLAKEKGVSILPVDSEHSAIFQSLQGNVHGDVAKILLTASGGPFRGKDTEFLSHVQVEDALKHPNWSMGRKITIDSATMVNKGLEVIEAKWLLMSIRATYRWLCSLRVSYTLW